MVWPADAAADLDEAALERLYVFPRDDARAWVAVNCVASVDGAVAVDGRSADLSNPADRIVYGLGRDLADVVLVGAGTAVAENYGGVQDHADRTERRARHGLADTAPVAVVTQSCSIAPDARLFTDTEVPPIILTCESAPASRRAALAAVGAEVIVTGADDVDLRAAVAALTARGLRRICCEGGPRLFATMLRDDLVDEVRLTVSPLLTAGDAGRIASGPALPEPARLRLASLVQHEDVLLARYLIVRSR